MPAPAYHAVFHCFTEAKVASLEAAISKHEEALTVVDDAGNNIHSRVLDQVITDALVADPNNPAPGTFEESYAALRWLLDRKAPYIAWQLTGRPEHIFITAQWADSARASIVSTLMSEYIGLGLIDVNELVLCEQWQGKGRKTEDVYYPALRASFHLGNHAAARQLLLAGADQAAALATTHHGSLAELAASYTMVPGHDKVAAVVTKTLMSMRIAEQTPPSAATTTHAARRSLAV